MGLARRRFQGKYGVRRARRERPTVPPAGEAIQPLQVVGSAGHRQFCPLSTAADRMIVISSAGAASGLAAVVETRICGFFLVPSKSAAGAVHSKADRPMGGMPARYARVFGVRCGSTAFLAGDRRCLFAPFSHVSRAQTGMSAPPSTSNRSCDGGTTPNQLRPSDTTLPDMTRCLLVKLTQRQHSWSSGYFASCDLEAVCKRANGAGTGVAKSDSWKSQMKGW